MGSFRVVGRALAHLRREAGLTLRDVGERMQPKRANSTIASVESGNPTADSIDEYLLALGQDHHALARALDAVAPKSGNGSPTEVMEPGPQYSTPDSLDAAVLDLKRALDTVVSEIREKGQKS